MRVEVKSTELSNVRPFKDKMYGDQQAALQTGASFPLPFRMNVEAGKEIAPGIYALDASSFATDKFGNLTINRVRLGERIPAPK